MRATIRMLTGRAPFVVLGLFVLLLLWMAGSITIRSGLLGVSGPVDPKQVGAFLTFIAAFLGTAATVFGALLTRAHNAREQQRLRLDSVIKSLESIPQGASRARLAGVLSTMALLGHHRVAIRVLNPAWKQGEVDAATATWVIGQVLVGAKPEAAKDDEGFDQTAVMEAATVLYIRAGKLTERKPGQYAFPGHFLRQWTTEHELPEEVKELLLLTIGRMLVGRDRSWWAPHGELPDWPVDVLVDCVRHERLRSVRSSAAVLLEALRHQFPKEFADFEPRELAAISARAKQGPVPVEFREFADHLRDRWDAAPATRSEVVVAGS